MDQQQPEKRPQRDIALISAEFVDGQVQVRWKNNAPPTGFSPFWLRDHCHGKHSLNADTLQREVDTFSIPNDITPSRIKVVDDGRTLNIVWAHDESLSTFPAAFLWTIAQTGGRAQPPHRTLWDRGSMGTNFPSVSHEEVMGSDEGLLRWLCLVEEFGFALTTGAEASMAGTEALVERVGYVRHTIFGGMWEFSANMAFKDTAYTSVGIGPHTDGTYSNDPPGFQMFQCLEFDGSGGESTLVDSFRVAETIRKTDPLAFRVLSEVKVPAHYLGDGVHLHSEHPIIGLDDRGNLTQIAYNNYDRAPFNLAPARMSEFYRALSLFHRLINDPAYEISMKLVPGTVLFFDNWRTLHGRHAFNGHRHMCGAYVNMEDFQSKLRVLRMASARS
jgi:trimethyllysine dioxygenase